MNRIALTHLSLCVMLGTCVSASVAGTDREIVVAGTAVLSITPDVIVWTVAVNTENPDLSIAKKMNDERVHAVLNVAGKIAIAPKDVEAGPVSIDRRYTRNDITKMQEFTHYSVRRNIVIIQRDLDSFENALNDLVTSAEVELSFSYKISNENEIRDNLRLKAIDAAKTKAKSMVERLGEDLGQVLTISEFPPDYRRDVTKGLPSPPRIIESASPEARLISVTVYATFEIE